MRFAARGATKPVAPVRRRQCPLDIGENSASPYIELFRTSLNKYKRINMKITRFSVFLSFTLLLVPATSYAVSFSEAPRIISGERDNNVHYAGGSRLVKDANCSNGSAAMLASTSLPRIVQGSNKNLALDPNIPHPIFRDGKETDALFI
jgi:hypothetical protein